MADRAALVTGASSGIGLAIAHMLGEEGHASRSPEFVRDTVPAEDMIRPSDVAAAVRFALHVSPACVIPEVIFQRPDESV